MLGIIISSIGGGILGWTFASVARQAKMSLLKDARVYLALGAYILALVGQHL